MALRTRIFLIAALLIIAIQGLNSALEIGFLHRNLTESHVGQYVLIGKEAKRKLEKSLLFGIPISQLNYKRLLFGMLPDEIKSFHVFDDRGMLLYSLEPGQIPPPSLSAEISILKEDGLFIIVVPLESGGKVVGNMAAVVSGEAMEEEIHFLIVKSLKHSALILIFALPLLFLVVTYQIDRPFRRSIRSLTDALGARDRRRLGEAGIKIDKIMEAESLVDRIRCGAWISVDGANSPDRIVSGKQNQGAYGGDETPLSEESLCAHFKRSWENMR